MLAAGVVAWGFGGIEARAGTTLPTTLDQLLVPGASVTLIVPPATEADTFSNFTYSSSPTTAPPGAAGITVSQFHVGIQDGLTFSGNLIALAGTSVDYSISYVVTAPAGFKFFDAFASGTANLFGGNGSVSVSETLLDAKSGALLGNLEFFSPPPSGLTTSITLNAASSSILVQKDIVVVGGTNTPTSLSIINQGFSSVPEPASMALLGIGMSGLFALRRFFKRPSLA